MTYATQEPNQVEVFKDQRGRCWETREEAIEANFEYDLKTAIDDAIKLDSQLSHTSMPSLYLLVKVVKAFIANSPDMVRVLLGDRDEI